MAHLPIQELSVSQSSPDPPTTIQSWLEVMGETDSEASPPPRYSFAILQPEVYGNHVLEPHHGTPRERELESRYLPSSEEIYSSPSQPTSRTLASISRPFLESRQHKHSHRTCSFPKSFHQTRETLNERYNRRVPSHLWCHINNPAFKKLIEEKVNQDIEFARKLLGFGVDKGMVGKKDDTGRIVGEIKDYQILRLFDAGYAAHERPCRGIKRYDGRWDVRLDGTGKYENSSDRFETELYFAEDCNCGVRGRRGTGRVSFGEVGVCEPEAIKKESRKLREPDAFKERK